MGKQQNNNDKTVVKSNKIHKTLREKLRKRREQLKQHKKEKREQKKQYNQQQEKLKYFSQSEGRGQNVRELKLKKITKYLQKFIDVYEDNLDDFYDMFKTFDEGGQIDISGLENKDLYKCIKKLFKYLPLKKEKSEFKKLQTAKVNLEKLIKHKVSESIEYYLQNGSHKQLSDNQSSIEENAEKNQKSKKRHVKPVVAQVEQQIQPIRLYKKEMTEPIQNNFGPCISVQDRQQLAQQFQKQLQQLKKQKEQKANEQEDEFDSIFNKGKTRAELKAKEVKQDNQGVPAHLMAVGSALIGQKVPIDQEEIDQYNKIHRPKKLVDIHKQIYGGAGEETGKKGFKREKQQAKADIMSNSMFFDFRNKMSKPSKTNQFL